MNQRRPRARNGEASGDQAPRALLTQAERSEERRREILDAALECFATGGLEELRVAHILARSGASVGSLYHHFGNLAGVLSALYRQLLEDYRAALVAALSQEASAEGWVKAVVRLHVAWSLENATSADYLHRARHLIQGDQDLKSGTLEFMAQLGSRVNAFVARGELRRLPAQLYVPVVLGPAQEWVRLRFARRTSVEPAEAAEELAAAAWRSVCP